MKSSLLIFWEAGERLVNDGGLANAGNIALSLLLSLFPFMILIAALANIWGDPQLLEEILVLLFDHWPAGSAGPIAGQVKVVLGQASGELLTIGNAIALVIATNGIESARDGLNRAYRFTETRSFFWRRMQGCLFVLVGALALIIAAIVLVGTPIAWNFAVTRLEWLSPLAFTVGLFQYGLALLLLWLTLFSFHYFLPDGDHKSGELFWGICVTIVGIFLGSKAFAVYLTNFADYASLYAGLAGIMIAIVYLYYFSVLILYGAEFNAALRRRRRANFGKQAEAD